MSRVNDVAAQLETVNSRPLDEGEQYDIELWQRGRALAHVVNSPGWEVILELLGSYAKKETARLVNTEPGSPDVLARHASAYAAERIFTLFTEDAQAMMAASQHVPEVVRVGLRNSSPVPPESL